jgi:catechol 2,3-dioxygenase-like lactoylglutathione lyase family enzyme
LRYQFFDLRRIVAGAKTQAKKKPPAKAGKAPARSSKAPKTVKAAAKPAAKPALKVVKGAPTAKVADRSRADLKVVKTSAPPRAMTTARLPFTVDHLHQVAMVATDLDAAVKFYSESIGLPLIARFDPPGLAFFELGNGMRLMLSATSSSATLYFYVKNLEASYSALAKRGVSFLHKPSIVHRDDAGHFGKKGVEEWMAFFKDPSGNMLALVSRK